MPAKQTFLEGQHRAEFEKIAGSKAFLVACDYALLALFEELPDASGDPNLQWAMHSQSVGARRFVDILRNLHLKEEAPKLPRTPTLKPPQ